VITIVRFFEDRRSQYDVGTPVVGYDGQLFRFAALKSGSVNASKEGYFEGVGRARALDLGDLRGYSSRDVTGLAISKNNFGFWSEDNELKCADLSKINDGFSAESIVWTKSLDGLITSSPIILPNNTVIIANAPKMLSCLDGTNGEVIWTTNTAFSFTNQYGFSTDNIKVMVAGFSGYLHLFNENKIITLNTTDGSFAWEYQHRDGTTLINPRVGSDGHIYFCANSSTETSGENVGGIASVDLKTRSLRWEKKYNHITYDIILGDQNNVFALLKKYGGETSLDCLNSMNGETNWNYTASNRSIYDFFLDNSGTLIVDGNVVETNSTGLDQGPWPILHQGYYNRRQALNSVLDTSTGSDTDKPTTLNLGSSWGWMELPWVYSNRLKEWIYLYSTTPNSLFYSSKYNAWYIENKNNSTWDLLE